MKKQKFILLIVLVVSLVSTSFPWGDDGHKLIAEKGLNFMPEKMQQFQPWFQSIVAKSVDPDYRKSKDHEEGPKHYIDLDFYKEIRGGLMITDRAKVEAIYSASKVKKMGLLPWALIDTYAKLVKAFKEKNKDNTILYMADLAHYTGDANQPMHTIMNYDGQLTNQTGVHARYEITMVEKHFAEIKATVIPAVVKKADSVEKFINSMIFDTHTSFPVLLYADSVSVEYAGKAYDEKYYNSLWLFTHKLTGELMTNASESLAALYWAAWQEAGAPEIKEFK